MGSSKRMCFVVQGFGEKTDFRTGRKLDLDASYDVIKEAVEKRRSSNAFEPTRFSTPR